MTGTATISDDGRYRYDLTRRWRIEDDSAGLGLWVMLNPSTADAEDDDATIRRCIGFSKREGWGGLVVVNLWPLRATEPRELLRWAAELDREYGSISRRPEYQQNAATIARWLETPDVVRVVCAWGAHGRLDIARPAVRFFAERAGRTLSCFGRTANGEPRHPLRLRADEPLERYP